MTDLHSSWTQVPDIVGFVCGAWWVALLQGRLTSYRVGAKMMCIQAFDFYAADTTYEWSLGCQKKTPKHVG